jgi:ribosomal protein S18 acetylase RimI-like enzyme
MNALVRPAIAEDAPAIATVHIETWQTAYRGQLSDAYLDNLSQEFAHRTEMWRSQIASSQPTTHEICVAEIDRHVVGFVALGPARDAVPEHAGEVYAIYVHPRQWSRGIGRRLFSHATERLAAHGFSTAMLWVLESNVRSRRFYEIAGWRVDGRTKTETNLEGILLREVSYSTVLHRKHEE